MTPDFLMHSFSPRFSWSLCCVFFVVPCLCHQLFQESKAVLASASGPAASGRQTAAARAISFASMEKLSITRAPQCKEAAEDMQQELDASGASRKRAWENLQEIRWVLKNSAGVSCLRQRVR